MNGAVSALGQSFLDGLAHALRTKGDDDHLAAVFLFLTKRFFEGVGVRLAHLVAEVAIIDPFAIGRNS